MVVALLSPLGALASQISRYLFTITAAGETPVATSTFDMVIAEGLNLAARMRDVPFSEGTTPTERDSAPAATQLQQEICKYFLPWQVIHRLFFARHLRLQLFDPAAVLPADHLLHLVFGHAIGRHRSSCKIRHSL